MNQESVSSSEPIVEPNIAVESEESEKMIPETEYKTLKQQLEDTKKELEVTKAHNEKVVADRKIATEKAAKAKAEAEGDYKTLLELKQLEIEDTKKEIKLRDDKLAEIEQKEKQNAVREEAKKIAQSLTKHGKRADDLTEKLVKQLQWTEDGIKVSENGKLTNKPVTSLADFARKEYDYLCDGIQSTGGAGVIGVNTFINQQPANNNDAKAMGVSRMQRARGLE